MLGLAILLTTAALLLLVVIARLFSLESRFRDLEDRLRIFEREQRGMASLPTPEAPPPAVTTGAARQAPGVAPAPSVVPGATASPTPTPEITRPLLPKSHPPLPLPEPPPVPAAPSRTREEWEALIGGKLLNRIGALALIIGVGFFLKHAIDSDWISEVTRVLIGVAIGVVSLLGADRARIKGFQIFSQGLVGAGLAILYLSVYATFNFYQLVTLPVAFGLMGAVTVIAFLEAFRNNSLAVSILACLGGLLTPVMLSTPEPNEIGLFAYLIALNLGVAVILLRNPSWVALEPLSLAGTYAIFLSWFSDYYTIEHTLPALIFLILFWAIYHILDIFRVVSARPLFRDLHRLIGWSHMALSAAALYGICIPYGDSRMALAAVIAALLYLGSAFIVERQPSGERSASIQYAVAGSTLLSWAIALEFESFTIICLWTVVATALVWVGTRYQRRYLWIYGLVLMGATGLALLDLDGSLFTLRFEGYQPVLNQRVLAYILLAAAGCASAYLIRKSSQDGSTAPVNILHCGWILLLIIMLTVETNDLFRSWMTGATDQQALSLGFARYMVIAAVWSMYGLVLVLLARRTQIAPVVFCGIAATFLAACLAGLRGISYDPLAAFTPVFNIRTYAILLVAAAMFLESRWLDGSKVRSTWIPEFREAMTILGVVLLLVLFTGETRDVFEQASSAVTFTTAEGSLEESTRAARLEEAGRLENLKQLSLSGVWLLFSIAVMALGIWRRTRALRLLAIGLFGVTILKIFIYDLSFLDTLYRIFSFVGLGLILLAVSYLYQRYRSAILGPSDAGSD